MPDIEHIIGLNRFKLLEVRKGKRTNFVSVECPLDRSCIYCKYSDCRIKETRTRLIQYGKFQNVFIKLILRFRRLYCKLCKKSFVEKIPGVKTRARATEAFKAQVFEDHQAGHSQKHLSKTNRICEATVGRWTKDFLLKKLKEVSRARIKCPESFGIDEHHFTKKKGFATTFTDLEKHRVFDVVLGRSQESLSSYLSGLKGKERVKLVTMDLSETYRSIVKSYFPNAKIIADRFHVVRLVMHAFHKVWSSIDLNLRYNRGLLSLVRRNPKNLTVEQNKKLNQYLQSNHVLNILYAKREELLSKLRLKCIGEYGFKHHVQGYLRIKDELKESPWLILQTLGETLESWSEEILRMWRFKKSNGMTEGFHNKMELISRRAYGFRNFQNYKLRVLALCGWDGLFAQRSYSKYRDVPRGKT
jgi:transposase